MHLLLIDGHRVFSTIFNAMEEKGTFGAKDFFDRCVQSVMKSIKLHQPTHVLYCQDDFSRSWRREMMPGYRQDRFKLQSSFEVLMPLFLKMLHKKGVSTLSISDSESYDIIATLTAKLTSAAPNAEVTILGTDKRLYSLISDRVTLTNPYSRYPDDITKNVAWLAKHEGVSAENWIDYLSLCGDKSRGIQGIPGVGPKTAKQLIEDHGSLEGVYTERSAIDGKIGNKIRDYIDSIKTVTYPICSLNSNLGLGINLSNIAYSQLAPQSKEH